MFWNCKKVDNGITASTDISQAVRRDNHWYLYVAYDPMDLPIGWPEPRYHVCGLVNG